LLHGLKSISGDTEPEGPASLEGFTDDGLESEGLASLGGSAGGGPGVTREGVGELGGVVAV
jgi:hypothetical protein